MKRKYLIRFLLCFTLGFYGAHKFQEKNYKMGFVYLFTAGLFLCGWIYDLIQLAQCLFLKNEEELQEIELQRIKKLESDKRKSEERAANYRETRKQQYIAKYASKANEVIQCPKCRGKQISAHKKGFGLGKAVVGTAAFGLLAGAGFGMIGKNKIFLSCMHCGYRWKPKR